jgi:glycine C-acetyltransferase
MEITVGGKKVLNFCANNYLGFADNKRIIAAAKKQMDTHGYGMASVRFICGTMDIHKQLEKKISEFHGTEDTILYSSCFDANGGVFEALLQADDVIISDELNHASIIDGIRLCKSKRARYKHLDMADLEKLLIEHKDCPTKLISTDGIFSMDGDIAPLPKIVELANKHDAVIFVDESHATGFIGETGRGTPQMHGVMKEIDIINSTLGKALGGATGGYTTGYKEIVDIIRNRGRPYLFSNSVAPPVVGAAMEVFDLLKDPSHVKKLRNNTHQFREGMEKAGFKILGHKECPIVPVWLGEAKLASAFAEEMMKYNIYVIGFSYPVVPKGKARIRVQLSSAHTPAQIDKAINAFTNVGKAKGVIN